MQLSPAELAERTAVLRRLRTLLEQQRAKFREYLNVLEKQADKIETEDSEALLAHTELEQQIAANIVNLQKVIEPIETMYRDTHPRKGAAAERTDNAGETDESVIPLLKTDLEQLQRQVLAQNARNRELLKIHIAEIKDRLNAVQNPYRTTHSVYTHANDAASVINISV